MLHTTALLLCYSHAGVASIAYGFPSGNTLDAWFNPCYCTSHFMPESPVPFEATFATHLTCPPSASSTATSLLVASSPETMLCNLDSQLCPSPADAPFPHVPISHSVPLVPASAVTAYGLQIEAANPCVPYDVPQFQSANNSTDGDTLAYNAAAALCVDHCRRRGKGSWIRDELYWNYLFSNKNCARVCSVFLGMVIPLGCLLLCLVATALIVGHACIVFYLLTNANGDPEFAYQTTSKWIFNLFICVAGAALCRASSYVVQMISDCREWYSGPPPPTSREAHNTLVVALFPINSCEPCESDVSDEFPRDRPGPSSGCCGARKYSCPNCRGARCTTCHWPTDVSPDWPRCMCLDSEPEIAAEAAPVASRRRWADVQKEEDDTFFALPIEWPDQCPIPGPTVKNGTFAWAEQLIECIQEMSLAETEGWRNPIPTLLALRCVSDGTMKAFDQAAVLPFIGRAGPYFRAQRLAAVNALRHRLDCLAMLTRLRRCRSVHEQACIYHLDGSAAQVLYTADLANAYHLAGPLHPPPANTVPSTGYAPAAAPSTILSLGLAIDWWGTLLIRTVLSIAPYFCADYLSRFLCNIGRVVARFALRLARCVQRSVPFAVICIIVTCRAVCVSAADDSTKFPLPTFDGQRSSFVAWFMSFTAYVAWKATDVYELVDGSATEPTVPEPTPGPDGAPTNAIAIATAQTALAEWRPRNMRLYGLLLQAVPAWIKTSLYHDFSGDGAGALNHLRATFDAARGDGSDHAVHLKRIGESVIESRRDLNEEDLRKQYNMMMTAKAAIQRTNNAAPDEATLKAMFDNALPIAYSQIRMLVRRQKHATFLLHYTDYMNMVRSEISARRPAPAAYGANANDGGGGSSGGGAGSSNANGNGKSVCIRCGRPDCKGRRNCDQPKARCRLCGADHLVAFCPKATGNHRRGELPAGALRLIDREMAESLAKRDKPHARAAAGAATSAAAAPSYAAAVAGASASASSASGSTAGSDPAEIQRAYAAAAAVAATETDPKNAANAYLAALQSFGYGLCARVHALKTSIAPPRRRSPPGAGATIWAFVDSMSTHFVVPDISMLRTVTDRSPGIGVDTANGFSRVEAVGTALVYLYHGKTTGWACYEIPRVLVMPNCDAILYSTRTMRDLFGFKHDFDSTSPSICCPGRPSIPIVDDGAGFRIPLAFVPAGGVPPPSVSHAAAAAFAASGSPMLGPGTTQSVLYRRLGFPYLDQWRHVPDSITDHGLPADASVSSVPVSDAIVRGRSRALPFHKHLDGQQPAPGAIFYLDGAGPLIASFPDGFTVYYGAVDAGSGYGRIWPSHHMDATSATSCLEAFIADVGAKLGLYHEFKPHVVRSDQGTAFTSYHFGEFLAARQIHQSLACTYTPQQNSHVERFFGIVFGTARVLLAAANLPPTFHPFALQTAAWLQNRLPRSTRNWQSPYFLLSRQHPSVANLYAFGCLCAATIPRPRREGDRHFADRGDFGLYLGPSEVSPGHVVYLFSTKAVQVVAKVRVWEDQFPGLKGHRYTWFNDSEPLPPDAGVPDSASAPPLDQPGAPGSADSTAPAEGDEPARDEPQGKADRSVRDSTANARNRNAPAQPAPAATPPSKPAAAPSTSPSVVTSGGAGGATVEVPVEVTRAPPRATEPVRMRSLTPPRRSARIRAQHLGQLACAFLVAFIAPVPRLSANMAAALVSNAVHGECRADDFLAVDNSLGAVDAAFFGYDSSNDTALVTAARSAGVAYSVTLTSDQGALRVPKSYRQAMSSPQAEQWREAIAKELAGLVALKTWDLVPLASVPASANVMHCHFVFAIKRKADGSIDKFKARLVADGNTQKHGVDFDRVFATVVKALTIRLVLAIAAARDYNLSSLDIRQAYLQAALDEDLYMRAPPGVNNRGGELVCKLRRSLYGLKQAGREWAQLLSSFLVSWGFVRSTIDVCLYTYEKDGTVLWALVYVDDILLADNCPDLRARFLADISRRFPTEDKGELEWILNTAITRNRAARSLTLSQDLYTADLVAKFESYFDRSRSRHFDSPIEEGLELSPADQPVLGSVEYDEMSKFRDAYMAIVGGLLWLANMTRVDIAYSASQLARFMTNPGPSHFKAAIRVLVYLRDTAGRALVMRPDPVRGLESFVDSSWATKFSCSGGMFFYYGCLFHWFSKMQRSVTLSSAEAEFFGAMLAAKEVIFIRELLIDLGIPVDAASVIKCDSKSAVGMAFDPVAFKKTKHILRAAEFLRDLVAREVVSVEHLPGAVMLADVLTKAASRAVFVELIKQLDTFA